MNQFNTHSDVMDTISELAQCTTEAEASDLTTNIVRTLGAQWFVYTTLLPPDFSSSIESYRFFIGCKPEWCEIYCKRKWMMNDPFFEYARTHSTPIVGSKIKPSTPGQLEMLKASAEHGFRSGLVVPTHTSMNANKRMGLLYIGTEIEPDVGEPLLLKKRCQFVALGFELLCWWNARLKQQAMRKYSLIEEEIELLQFSKNGKVASEIAAMLEIKASAVYRKLDAIKEKFNVDKIDRAVIHADAAGLLG